MIFDNIYKNTITFNTVGNVEFRFTDNKSQTRYLLDIVIDNNIMINNVFSIGTFKNMGTTINNSTSSIGINLDSTKITLVMTGNHIVDIKIKQGIFTGTNNSVATPSYFTIPIGYSFGVVKQMMTDANKLYYTNTLLSPLENDLLAKVNSLLDSTEVLGSVNSLYSPYFEIHNNTTYPKFSYISKLNASNISDYISDASIPNSLFINGNITKTKLDLSSQNSIDLADTSVQNIYINSKALPETKTSGAINLNLSDKVRTLKKDGITYFNYIADVGGIGLVQYDSIDIQSKILNTNIDGKKYFISYSNDPENRYSYEYIDMDLFFKKENNIKLAQFTTETDDLLYSSSKTKSLLDGKVDTLASPLAEIDDKFIKFRINTQGQVIDNVLVARTDLSNLLDSHYQRSGVKKVINTSRSTVFFM